MQKIQQLMNQISTQLARLPVAARMLIVAMMVILALSLFVVGQLAGKPEMAILPISNLTPEARQRAMEYLENRPGLTVQVRGNQVLVPAGQTYTILAELSDNQVLSPAMFDFDMLVQQFSPFASRYQNQQQWLAATMNVLEKTISRMKGITGVTVVIAAPDRLPGIGSSATRPSATVTVETTGGDLSHAQVDAIAAAVARAQPRLKVEDVAIVNLTLGRSYKPRGEDDFGAHQYLEIKVATENQLKKTIKEFLSYIPNVRVAVNAQVDTRPEVIHSEKFSEAVVGPSEDSSRTITSNSQKSGGEPGVGANTGVSIASSGNASQFSDEKTNSKVSSVFPVNSTTTQDPKGYALKINASIFVPRSYFISRYQHEQDDENATPDEATIQQMATTELDAIKAAIEPLIDTDALNQTVGVVAVHLISDFATTGIAAIQPGMAGGGGAEGVGGSEGSAGGLVGGGMIKSVSLGALALVSLFMMFMMVRKANVREELPTAEELVGIPAALQTTEADVVGEADEGTPAMEGIELKDDDIRTQQILEQVNDMVRQSPEESSVLMRKWLRSP